MNPTNTLEKKSSRIEWIDIAKCFCIILMVVGHTVEYGSLSRNIIFSFHMPLFIVLSGFTFNTNTKPADILKKTWQDIKRLVVPALVTVVIGMLFHISTFEPITGTTIKDVIIINLKALFWSSGVTVYNQPALGALWFLITLFWARLIVRIVTAFFSFDASIFVLSTMSLVGVLFANRFYLPQNFDVTLAMLFFFTAGMLWKKHYDVINKYSMILFFLSMVILSYLLYHGIYIEMASRMYPLGLVSFVEALCGTFICCKFSEAISELGILNKAFTFIGQGTLLILCIHHLDYYVSSLWTTDNLLLSCVLRLAFDFVVFFVIIVIKKLFKKITHKNS